MRRERAARRIAQGCRNACAIRLARLGREPSWKWSIFGRRGEPCRQSRSVTCVFARPSARFGGGAGCRVGYELAWNFLSFRRERSASRAPKVRLVGAHEQGSVVATRAKRRASVEMVLEPPAAIAPGVRWSADEAPLSRASQRRSTRLCQPMSTKEASLSMPSSVPSSNT